MKEHQLLAALVLCGLIEKMKELIVDNAYCVDIDQIKLFPLDPVAVLHLWGHIEGRSYFLTNYQLAVLLDESR